jgi:ribosomal protein L11 methyltransferase
VSSYKLTIDVAARDAARSLAGALQELVSAPPQALTLFEQADANGAAPAWRIEAYYDEPPDPALLGEELAALLDAGIPALTITPVEQLNWVALSQAALPPVAAGRFTVHGSHDAGRVPRGPNAILIDAGEAFGTAHHATTFGCLSAIDALTRRRHFARVLDLGCGSGVLAIAAARALPRAVILATDLDAQSVVVAKSNMRQNGAGRRIDAFVADGLAAPRLRRAGQFDLVIANILADPLIALAREIRRALCPGGALVLSGLLIPQAPAVIAAYRAAGFALVTHRRILGWSTLTLVRL